ncbi:MAG: type II toxin-antitoxin system RelE/ParE family toxin [Alphaproteobacteria bacterium]|nr:MAG: type II toxin-antitoxin system RelE/ParE family toxin [Alphaproteobacteria bacterium]
MWWRSQTGGRDRPSFAGGSALSRYSKSAIWDIVVTKAAEKEIRTLPPDMQARFLRIGEMLARYGPLQVGMPYVRSLGRGLWEMRLTGRDGIARAIYFAADRKQLVVVRAFVKKTQKTPLREIELALRRMKDWKDGQEL